MSATGLRVAVASVALITFSCPVAPPARAQSSRTTEVRPRPTESRRAVWAAVLGATVGVGALATGGAYWLRDNAFGRGIAVTAGSWGGASLGAGAAYGLASLSPCRAVDCEDERAVPVFLGALLGGVAGSLLATWQTRTPGMSRPTTTALGIAPFFLYASLGTIFDW